MEISVELEGLDDLLKMLLVEGRELTREVGRTLYREANDVFDRSQDICPIDTGALRSSGVVNQPEVEGDDVFVLIQYGGAAAPYAVIQHENLEYYHEPPTQAKYLEAPLVERTVEFNAAMREVLGKAIAGEMGRPAEED